MGSDKNSQMRVHKRYAELSNATGGSGHKLLSQKSKASQADRSEFSRSVAAGEGKLHLVPTRWNPTGWKYTEKDPKTTSFFGNPNRINFHGMNQSYETRKRDLSPSADFGTTYGNFFARNA